MPTRLEIVEEEALKLTVGERAALAQHLLASLDEDSEIEEAWAVEVERRLAEVESGAVQAIPIAETLAQARAFVETYDSRSETGYLLQSTRNAERLLGATAQLASS